MMRMDTSYSAWGEETTGKCREGRSHSTYKSIFQGNITCSVMRCLLNDNDAGRPLACVN